MSDENTPSTTLFAELGAVESWKLALGYPDYEVSDMGRIRCMKDRRGGKKAPFSPAIRLSASGRPMIIMRNHTGQKARRVDEVVLEAFSGPRPGPDYGPTSINGDRADVRADNLAWAKGAGSKTIARKTRRAKKKVDKRVPKISDEIRHGHWLGTGNVIVSIQPNRTIELTVDNNLDHHVIPVQDLDDVIRVLQAARTIIDGG